MGIAIKEVKTPGQPLQVLPYIVDLRRVSDTGYRFLVF